MALPSPSPPPVLFNTSAMISFSFRYRAVVRDPASLSAEVEPVLFPIRYPQFVDTMGHWTGHGHLNIHPRSLLPMNVDSSNGPEPLYTPVICRTRKDFWIRKLWSARPEEMLAYTWRSPNLGNNGIVTCGDRFSHTVTNLQVILRLAGLSRAPQRKPRCSVMLISMLPLSCLPPRVHDPSVPSS
ncbi:hypothetical protein CDEST_08068 [Colletotrichum destructivum]|uniref:Uncharacterized protein n=1 Tax=Colletotrichum destructivum TaxID=34406 RepID=A0AAX4IIG4_9PEZI|nr:hypothetical protein CDEST_08068 [Colletotrichum destructivum]